MLAKMARSAPRSPFGVPRMTAIVRAAKRSCQNAAKAQKSTTVRGSSGESRFSTPEVEGEGCSSNFASCQIRSSRSLIPGSSHQDSN